MRPAALCPPAALTTSYTGQRNGGLPSQQALPRAVQDQTPAWKPEPDFLWVGAMSRAGPSWCDQGVVETFHSFNTGIVSKNVEVHAPVAVVPLKECPHLSVEPGCDRRLVMNFFAAEGT